MTEEELTRLASPEFNRILADDPVLTELRSPGRRKGDALRLFFDVAGLGERRIGSLPCKPLTAAKWVFLSILGNGFVCGGKKATVTDANVFLFVLSNDLRNEIRDLELLPALASDYAAATGLGETELYGEIHESIREAFHPLSMLSFSERGEKAEFDALWLAQTVGVAARESGEDSCRVMHEMPLSAVFAWYAAWCARETTVKIVRATDPETETLIEKRIAELQEMFLKQFAQT